MDTVEFGISPLELYRSLGTASHPLVIDVRREVLFAEDQLMIAAAIRVTPEQINEWAHQQANKNAVVVYCAHGHEVSQRTVAILFERGFSVRYLTGGIEHWRKIGLPTFRKRVDYAVPQSAGSLWVTREQPKIDRIACPWLIRRFIDPLARFLYVPTTEVFSTAQARKAVAYDIPGAPLEHHEEECSFDAFLRQFGLYDAALDEFALIVRAADTGRLDLAPQAAGLLAISLGLSVNFPDDQAMLEQGMILYDALYAWCRKARGETHNWVPATMVNQES